MDASTDFEDRRSCELALAMGLLDRPALEDALRLLAELRSQGEAVRAIDFLVRQGNLTPDEARAVASAAEDVVLVCAAPGCAKKFRIRGWKPDAHRCRACGGALRFPPPPASDHAVTAAAPRERASARRPVLVEHPAPELPVLESVLSLCGPTAEVRLEGAPGPGAGLSIGRYLGGEEIGRGGMGIVFRGVDRDLGRAVAIKVLDASDRAARRKVWRFFREARITGQLEHPNIPPIYEIARSGAGRLYFVMKLVEGRSLAAVLSETHEEGPGAVANRVATREADSG